MKCYDLTVILCTNLDTYGKIKKLYLRDHCVKQRFNLFKGFQPFTL